MSTSYVEAAPGPSIPGGYSYDRSRAPPTSRRRPSPAKRRSINDARLVTASPDVIGDLLASFNSISAPSEDRHLHPALRAPSFGLSSSEDQQHYSFLAPAAPSPIVEYAPSTRHSSITTATWAPDDAAEPPVVRTNRTSVTRPSSNWRRSSSSHGLSFERSNKNFVPGNVGIGDWETELLQPDDELSPLPSDVITLTDNPSPRRQRSSMDVFGSEIDIYSGRSSISRDIKGKGKALDVPETRPPRNHAYDSHRQGAILTPPTPGSKWESRHSTARSSMSIGLDSNNGMGPYRPHRRISSVDHAGNDHKANERLKTYQSLEAAAPTPAFLESKLVVPPRGSSLKRVDSLTLLRRRGSVRSTVSIVPEVVTPTKIPHQGETQDGTDTNEEQSEVLKRINELRTANEIRRRSMKEPFTHGFPVGSSNHTYAHSMSILRPQASTIPLRKTVSQIKLSEERPFENFQQDETRPSTSGTSDSFAISSTVSSVTRMSADILPVEYVNFSRDRPTVVRSASPGRFRESAESDLSTQGTVKYKRWSQPTQEFRSVEESQKRDMSARISPLTRPQIVEERKTSGNVVSDSVSAYLQSTRLSQKVRAAKENRTIAFSEVGDPRGHVVFCCVGMGMTRYIMTFYDELATSLKLRLITPDRPGIGDSEPYPNGPRQPISWPDDVQTICEYLGIAQFSLLAHSAGAIYALAVALSMPTRIRGKIHLLAPWIPPSQMVVPITNGNHSLLNGPSPARVLPRSQRFLRILPTPFLKLSTSSWALNATFVRTKSPKPIKSKSPMERFRHSSDTSAGGPSPRISFGQLRAAISRRPSDMGDIPAATTDDVVLSSIPDDDTMSSFHGTGDNSLSSTTTATETPPTPTIPTTSRSSIDSVLVRQRRYDAALTPAIWELATKNANPTVDLLVCLERQQTIGFRYADVDISSPVDNDLDIERLHTEAYSHTGIGVATGTGYDAEAQTFSTERPRGGTGATGIVIHHGSKDARVPLENVKWLSNTMKATEVRVVEGEGHGLMASAGVMSGVLTEMGRELDELMA